MEDTQITVSVIVHEAAFAKEESYFLILQIGETEKVGSIRINDVTQLLIGVDSLGCVGKVENANIYTPCVDAVV